MAFTIKFLHRSHIPGIAGFNNTGSPRQGKVEVIGEIDITSYTASGEVVSKNKLGLSTIDSIVIQSKEFVNTDTLTRLYVYERSNDKIIGYAVDTAGGTGDELSSVSGDLGILGFSAIGDSSLPTENALGDSINTVAGTPLA